MTDTSNEETDHRLDLALARLAAATAGPAAGFADRVMARLPERAMQAFALLVIGSRELQQQCSAIGSKQELVEWLRRTAALHRLDSRPLLAQVDAYFDSANDGELDDAALDAVVGAGTPGSHYLTGLLRILADPV